MINLSLITEQIVEHFSESEALHEHKIVRSEPVNRNAEVAQTGWIGVYKDLVNYDPSTLAISRRRYRGTPVFRIVVQRISRDSGEEAEEFLETSVKDVMEALVGVAGEVDGIKTRSPSYIKNFEGFEIEYGSIDTDKSTFYFQQATIAMTVEIDTDTT